MPLLARPCLPTRNDSIRRVTQGDKRLAADEETYYTVTLSRLG